MAEAVTEEGARPAAAPQLDEGLVRRRRAPVGRYGHRFGVAYLVLAVIVGAAVGGLIVGLGEKDGAVGSQSAASGWSAWQPSEVNNTAMLEQIATHVGRQYRRGSGAQLVGVIPKLAEDQGIPITALVIHTGLPNDNPPDLRFVLVNRGAMYLLCGSGSSCQIPGNATVDRGRLLRREALELALYTFKYAPSIDTVITFVPPIPPSAPGESPVNRLVLLQRNDLAEQLAKPLAQTLSPDTRLVSGKLGARESERIDRLTRYHFFTVSSENQLADGTIALTVAPPSL